MAAHAKGMESGCLRHDPQRQVYDQIFPTDG